MIYSLLEGESTNTGALGGYGNWIMLGVLGGILIVVVVVMYVLGNKKRKKQEQDAKDLINAVKPGNKVKTIGGICGIVVEVDDDDNTFVLETGTELSGKSFIKFDRQAIYQTDAVVEKTENVVTEEAETSEKVEMVETADAVETVEAAEPVAAPAVESPVEEVSASETAPAEETAPKSKKSKKN